jgi:hypothetical protein
MKIIMMNSSRESPSGARGGWLQRGLALWLALPFIASANGGLRQFVLIPHWGEKVGHVVSTLLLAGLIVGVTTWAGCWLRLRTPANAWRLGALWLLLTVGFEFFFGHFVFRTPWAALLREYDVTAGRIWVLVLAAALLAPVIAFHVRRPREA